MAFVLAVLGVIIGVAVPSYASFQQRQELRAAGDALAQDLRNAREMSVNSNAPIFVSYRAGAKQWCWGISRGQPCDCGAGGVPACNLSRGDSTAYPNVILDIAQDAQFSPGVGQVAQTGAAALRTAKGLNLRVVLNPMGRANICGQDSRGSVPC